MDEIKFARKIKDAGGEIYLVGGCVRDRLLGKKPNDKDYLLCGISEDVFIQLFPRAVKVGKSFPVYLMYVGAKRCEIAFARTERKTGQGYTGFSVDYNPHITVEEDLYRRDLTINSMAYSVLERKLTDPFGGRRDLKNKILRATSEHFSEDPVRALRTARFAAQLDFAVSHKTLKMMASCARELANEPKPRILSELEKALSAQRPSIFFLTLKQAGLLNTVFPEIAALSGKSQPAAYHPEGDAFQHTMMVLDEAAKETKRPEVRFGALMHDIGKGRTPEEMLPHHLGHEQRGVEIIQELAKKFELPKKWRMAAEFAAAEHMRPARLKQPAKIVDLLVRLQKNPLGIEGFSAIVKADNHGENAECLVNADKYIEAMKKIKAENAPKDLKGTKLADWIKQKQIEAVKQLTADSKNLRQPEAAEGLA
ncbi:MAG: HD domain-containing protein [Synergistaceae bacterium]|nr:HD domain-containing protein [Synergistaceae bacterium]